MKTILFFFAISLLPIQLFAAREVEFEWEEIEGAKTYQVEINRGSSLFKSLSSDSFIFKTEMPPGKYQIRGKVIGKDLLQTHSEWSPWKDFDIPPDQVSEVPLMKTEYKVAPPSFTAKIPIEWKIVPGASEYIIEVTEINKKETKTIIASSPSTTLQLRPGFYSINISSRTNDGLTSEPFEAAEKIFVQNITVPPPEKIEINKEQGLISYQASEGAVVLASLEKQAFLSTHWKKIALKSSNEKFSEWDPNLGPGKYRVTLVAKNTFGEISKPITREFVIKPKEADLPLSPTQRSSVGH